MKHPCPLSEQALLSYSEQHVFYEFEMFFLTSDALLRKHLFSPAVYNALVESFAIHLRNLTDFFFEPANAGRDDIFAWHYLAAAAQPNCLGQLSLTLKHARERANKEVGHLTTKRHDDASPNKPWPAQQLAKEILELSQVFVANSDSKKLCPGIYHLIARVGR